MSQELNIVARAASLIEPLRAAGQQIEAERGLTEEVVTRFADAGLFRMLAPKAVGGLEVHPAEFVGALETLARGDSAAAWCAMTAGTTGLATAYLDPEIATLLWSAAEPLSMAGVFAPMGRAIPVEGGYRLSGRWPFGSGAGHSTWLMLGGLVMSDATEKPALAAFFVHRDDVTIHDTWKVSGLRGTGSHDLSVDDVFVPIERVVSLTTGSPNHDGRLFRFPIFGLLACGVSAVGLGIARASLDDFHQANCSGARPSRAASDSVVQVAIAEAEGKHRAAQAYLFSELDRVWNLAEGPLEPTEAADVRLAALHAVQASVSVVDAVYAASGGSAIYEKNRQERHFRDIHVVRQHIMVSPRASKLIGRVLMGIKTDTSQL